MPSLFLSALFPGPRHVKKCLGFCLLEIQRGLLPSFLKNSLESEGTESSRKLLRKDSCLFSHFRTSFLRAVEASCLQLSGTRIHIPLKRQYLCENCSPVLPESDLSSKGMSIRVPRSHGACYPLSHPRLLFNLLFRCTVHDGVVSRWLQ